MDSSPLNEEIRAMVIETLMLSLSPEELGDGRPLFGPQGLGLDSVDALQLVVALDKKYGVKITDKEVAEKVLRNVAAMTQAVQEHRACTGAKGNPAEARTRGNSED